MLLFFVLLVLVGLWLRSRARQLSISSFEECVNAGYPVTESYPSSCRIPDGKVFTQDIGNELEKQDLVRVDEPRPNTTVSSPLIIRGEARGDWFFEASFPIRLVDENGKELGRSVATAKGEWMTEDFVPFESELNFDAKSASGGMLILEKDNPSGLPENADELSVPVRFGDIGK